ncbi:MAG: tetratricopeptide repeat protein [Algiphilus sp.]
MTVLVLPMGVAGAQDHEDDKQPTKRTQTIRPATFEKMQAAQEAMDAGNYNKALASLDKVKENLDSLNDYERATLYNLYASIYYQQDKTEQAIEAYKQVLKQEKLPEGLRNSTIFAIAQSYFVLERYDRAIRVLERWFEMVESPSADSYMLLAQAHYQQEDYAKARDVMFDALRVARSEGTRVKENWLGLLRAVFYELEDYDKAARILQLLVERYPKESYYVQLAGMYGLMGEQKKQLGVLHAAWTAGMISQSSNLLNLARLYMVEDAPYPAVRVMTKGFKRKIISPTPENLQLYAQALGLAQQYETQVKVLKRLADESGEAKHYVFLGQGLSQLGRFEEAAAAFANALASGDAKQPGRVHMQRGQALFNAGALQQAKDSFQQALNYQDTQNTAQTWMTYVNREIKRREALKEAG